jgi:prepilin-type N-terminal cleavage/methylation domain-containing protein
MCVRCQSVRVAAAARTVAGDSMRAEVLHRRGFVLIELIVVVTIIAMLAVGAWFSSRYLVVNSKVARVKEEEKTLMRALSNYEIDYSALPDSALGLRALNAPTAYLASLPRDPFSPERSTYRYVANPFSEFRYLLVSPGPDGEYDLDPAAFGGAMGVVHTDPRSAADFEAYCRRHAYDPTNGVDSSGDIFVLAR